MKAFVVAMILLSSPLLAEAAPYEPGTETTPAFCGFLSGEIETFALSKHVQKPLALAVSDSWDYNDIHPTSLMGLYVEQLGTMVYDISDAKTEEEMLRELSFFRFIAGVECFRIQEQLLKLEEGLTQ